MVRWDSNSKDADKLMKMFQNGQISTDATPKMILDSVPDWKAKYKTDQFRNAFNRFKVLYGTNVQASKAPPVAAAVASGEIVLGAPIKAKGK